MLLKYWKITGTQENSMGFGGIMTNDLDKPDHSSYHRTAKP